MTEKIPHFKFMEKESILVSVKDIFCLNVMHLLGLFRYHKNTKHINIYFSMQLITGAADLK